MSRRELLVNWCRLVLLKWRLIRGCALPSLATSCLHWLDAYAARLRQGGER
jgi:hypothetical protein